MQLEMAHSWLLVGGGIKIKMCFLTNKNVLLPLEAPEGCMKNNEACESLSVAWPAEEGTEPPFFHRSLYAVIAHH